MLKLKYDENLKLVAISGIATAEAIKQFGLINASKRFKVK